jgi:hypothetical protein
MGNMSPDVLHKLAAAMPTLNLWQRFTGALRGKNFNALRAATTSFDDFHGGADVLGKLQNKFTPDDWNKHLTSLQKEYNDLLEYGNKYFGKDNMATLKRYSEAGSKALAKQLRGQAIWDTGLASATSVGGAGLGIAGIGGLATGAYGLIFPKR